MSPKTYQADTMAAALAKVKQDLGQRAVILRTRTVKTGGLFGVGCRSIVEITAGRDTEVLAGPANRGRVLATGGGDRAGAKGVAMQPAKPLETDAASTTAMRRELQDIKSLVQDLVQDRKDRRVAEWPEALRQAYIKLIQNEVAEEMARDFVEQLQAGAAPGQSLDASTIDEFLVRQLARVLTPGGPIRLDASGKRGNVVVLVGATGVGKTTTLAKLAAQFRIKEGKKVGLITIDTYRIGAVEQLRTYARIIDTPLEVVLTPQELRLAIERLADCDIILVDTAGRSQFDSPKLDELREFLKAANPRETHLVLSATSSRAVLQKSIELFSGLGVNRVLFTKLDEAVGIGTLLAAVHKLDVKLSYITTGQDVPHDIEVGDGRRLAEMILGGTAPANN